MGIEVVVQDRGVGEVQVGRGSGLTNLIKLGQQYSTGDMERLGRGWRGD